MRNIGLWCAFVLLFFSAGGVKAQTEDPESAAIFEGDKIYRMNEVDKPPRIPKIKKARTEDVRGRCEGAGQVRLRLVFLKTGKVGNIEVLNSSPCIIFNESAMNIAKKIKFEPAIKDGELVSVRGTIEFFYTK